MTPDVVIPDGFLPYLPVAWWPVMRYQRDDDGELVTDPCTGWPVALGRSKRMRARPIGWLDKDDDGAFWALS